MGFLRVQGFLFSGMFRMVSVEAHAAYSRKQ